MQPEKTTAVGRHRECVLCEGAGCEECDGTGQRVATGIALDGGGSMVVHGSAHLSPESAEALREIGNAAIREMSDRPTTGGFNGLTTCPQCGKEF